MPDRVEILTDAAHLKADGTGRLQRVASKVWISRRSRLAVSGRGDARMVRWIGACIALIGWQRGSSFDRSIAGLLAKSRLLTRPQPLAEIVVAGVSERDGPAIYGFLTAPHDGWAPFEMKALSPLAYGGPDIGPMDWTAVGGGLLPYGTTLFEAARNTPDCLPGSAEGGAGGHTVGGFVEWTRVPSTGVVERIVVRRWSDSVGEVIKLRRPKGEPNRPLHR